MIYILNIDTALETASICLSGNGSVLQYAESKNQNDHSRWLHMAIEKLLQKEKISLTDLSAIAVSIGPGSYTGLRVGLSTSKGLCYALQKPLITVNNLLLIAIAQSVSIDGLICPCIDARRMEVYTCLFDAKLNVVENPFAKIIDADSFVDKLEQHKILFCGNAVEKIRKNVKHRNAFFSTNVVTARELSILSYAKYKNREFENLATTEPLYIKNFFTNNKSI